MAKENLQAKRMSDEWSDCEVCGESFRQPRYYKNKVCSNSCKGVAAALRAQVEIACEQCGKDFGITNTQKKKGTKYCSTDCYHKSRFGLSFSTKEKIDTECPICGKKFRAFASAVGKFCSVKCSGQSKRKKKLCPCGEETRSKQATYCSDECVGKYGKVGPRKPQVTYVCQHCNEEFHRYASYTGKKMYCSLKCSNANPSYTRIKRFQFGDLTAEGMYEVRFIAICGRFDLKWTPFDRSDCFEFEIDGVSRRYGPDFVVECSGEPVMVEVKGYDGSENQISMRKKVIEAGINLKIVRLEDLKALESMTSRSEVETYLS